MYLLGIYLAFTICVWQRLHFIHFSLFSCMDLYPYCRLIQILLDSNMPCSCCLKFHLHTSPKTLGSEHCQTGFMHSMRDHCTREINILILGHHFEIALNTSQVRLNKPKKKCSKVNQNISKVHKYIHHHHHPEKRKEKVIFYSCWKV